MGRLSGKTAVITGAGSGIGRASSLLFAAEGASLVIADKMDSVNETAKLVAEAGGKAIPLVGDAGEEAFVESLIGRAVSEYGGLDVVWANAGISGGWTTFDEQDAAFWAEILRVNLIGAFLAVKHASRYMIPKGKGSIICTASVAGIRSGAGGSPYSASKAGVINLAQTSANEFYGTGVRVNAICPAARTPAYDRFAAASPDNAALLLRQNPSGRMGDPEQDIGAMVSFMCSAGGAYMTGNTVFLDGGSHINGVSWLPSTR